MASAGELPQVWKLQACLSVGYTTRQPCAFLDQHLTLRVENPTGTVVLKSAVSPDVALSIYEGALSAIRSFDRAPGREVLDGTLFTVSLHVRNNTAEVKFGDSDLSNMGPEVRKLERLLHEAAGGAF
jgi:hypothetical protein